MGAYLIKSCLFELCYLLKGLLTSCAQISHKGGIEMGNEFHPVRGMCIFSAQVFVQLDLSQKKVFVQLDFLRKFLMQI